MINELGRFTSQGESLFVKSWLLEPREKRIDRVIELAQGDDRFWIARIVQRPIVTGHAGEVFYAIVDTDNCMGNAAFLGSLFN